MFLHSTREGDHPNQIQHPENIPHPLQTAGPIPNEIFIVFQMIQLDCTIPNEIFIVFQGSWLIQDDPTGLYYSGQAV